MTKTVCVHGVDLDWECDLCWDLVDEIIKESEQSQKKDK
jgi:hypothetical protein